MDKNTNAKKERNDCFTNMIHLEQYVDSIIDFTSQYSNCMSISFSPTNLVGKPVKYPAYGDFPDTYMLRSYGRWWSNSEGAQKPYMTQDVEDIISEDYVVLRFEIPVVPTAVMIYETYNPGAVVRIWGRCVGGDWWILWEGKPEICTQTPRKFSPPIRDIMDLVNEIRLDFNQSLVKYHTSLDAVLLAGKRPTSQLQMKLLQSGFLENLRTKKSQQISYDIDETTNFFATLPYEVIVHIFQYLDLKSLCRCAQVNKLWQTATQDPYMFRELSLKRYWHKVDDNLLKAFAKRCRGLKKLDLSWCGSNEKISEASFLTFVDDCCKHLTHLSLCNCDFVKVASLAKISTLQDLTDLSLRQCRTDVFKYVYLANLHNLVSLDLYSTGILDDSLIKILIANPNLKHINVDICDNLTRLDQVTQTVSLYNKNLVTWSSWKTSSLTSVGVSNLARCYNLRELDLGWCLILNGPDDCLEKIAQGCKDLRRLIISGWRGVSDHHLLPVIRSCKQLRQLDLLGITNFSGDICDRALASLPKLELLDVSFCRAIKEEQVAAWRVSYPNVVIQRSCDCVSGHAWNNMMF